MDTAKLEKRIDQLQSELRKIQAEVLKNRQRKEDRKQNQKWKKSGLLPEGWCVHRIVFGRREYYVICDVPDFYEQNNQIRIRFYTPDIHDDISAERCITEILQSIQILSSGK